LKRIQIRNTDFKGLKSVGTDLISQGVRDNICIKKILITFFIAFYFKALPGVALDSVFFKILSLDVIAQFQTPYNIQTIVRLCLNLKLSNDIA
jgi:hypothetical protein